MSDEKARRQARVDGLTDHQRRVLLAWLCGYKPQVIDEALAELGLAAAQAGEARDG